MIVVVMGVSGSGKSTIGKLLAKRGDPNDCAIAAAVIGLAHTLGLEAVAEGVETVDQERFLRAVGGRMVQGYRYARPLPAPEFAEFMVARTALARIRTGPADAERRSSARGRRPMAA